MTAQVSPGLFLGGCQHLIQAEIVHPLAGGSVSYGKKIGGVPVFIHTFNTICSPCYSVSCWIITTNVPYSNMIGMALPNCDWLIVCLSKHERMSSIEIVLTMFHISIEEELFCHKYLYCFIVQA